MQLNPSKWRISGTALLVTLLLCLAGITLLFNLDPQYGVRWIPDYVVYALLLTIPTVIALRLRTVGISVMWVVVACILIVIGAVAAIGIIVAMTGAPSGSNPIAELLIYAGGFGLFVLTALAAIAYFKSDRQNMTDDQKSI
ncbi:MAG: hypothetical protein P8Q50_07260 [Octadecabacter sp.]|jgi:peptidoglycan/LPS O-acetylase OafA/YrhL|nr:hypothetical protein [Octadecabacter sp.]